MIKSSSAGTAAATMSYRLQPVIRKLVGFFSSTSNIKLFSEDTIYKWHFIRNYMPELYKQHILKQYENCVYCKNLKGTGCVKHCFKCSAGTYIHSSPLLPGTLYSETYYPNNSNMPAIPWYYKKACQSFIRLPQNSYFKNFGTVFSSTGIYNFEVLEGLEKGLSAGERPCHVCASTNYEIYKKCSAQKSFDPYSPCNKVNSELSGIFVEREFKDSQ